MTKEELLKQERLVKIEKLSSIYCDVMEIKDILENDDFELTPEKEKALVKLTNSMDEFYKKIKVPLKLIVS